MRRPLLKALFILDVHINTIYVAEQVSSIMGTISQALGTGMAGRAFACLAIGGVRCGRGHINAPLARGAPTFSVGRCSPDFIVDQQFAVGRNHAGNLLASGYNRTDPAFAVVPQHGIFPAQI